MAQPVIAPALYQDVSLSPTPASPSSVLHINASGSSQQLSLLGAGRKRQHNEIRDLDEESYARRYLAAESSIFFRRKTRSARSFLWRVLDDRRLLEVQCVDLIQEKGQADAGWLTFHITLPAAVARGGVAFADPDETDALEVFVLTEANELFTITLKRDLLTRKTLPKEFDSATVVKKFAPTSFGFRYPYRMIAASSLELIISLHDGGLARLVRQPAESGTHWRESIYSESSWGGTLKGLNPLKRRQTVRYENLDLETSAAADLAASPDGHVVWTVSLDHMLKAWSTRTGKLVYQQDLLKERVDAESHKRQPRFVMAAEQGTLIRIVSAPPTTAETAVARMDEDGYYYLMVHSPKDHQFKIYEVTTQGSSDGPVPRCAELHKDMKLIPPIEELLNTNIWHLDEFHIKPGAKWQDSQLWIQARSGAVCKTYGLVFDGLAEENTYDLEDTFQRGWTVVDSGALSVERLRECSSFPGPIFGEMDPLITPTERWLAFLFYPERFSAASIEAALNTYRKRRKLTSASNKDLSTAQSPLQERLIAAVTSKIILQRSATEQPDFDQYHFDVHAQWTAFYSVLEEIHKRRMEPLSLAFDQDDLLPWDVSTDMVAPVRTYDGLELLLSNTAFLDQSLLNSVTPEVANMIFPSGSAEEDATTLTVLLTAARHLRSTLTHDARDVFRRAAYQDAVTNEDDDDITSLGDLCEKADLHDQVPDETFEVLQTQLTFVDGIGGLDGQLFLSTIQRLDDTMKEHGSQIPLDLSRYGNKMTVAIAQDSLQQTESILLDLLVLVAFLVAEIKEVDLHHDFNNQKGRIHEAILTKLRHVALRQWLLSNEYSERSGTQGAGDVTATVFENFFIAEWDAEGRDKEDDMPTLLTSWSKRWAHAMDLYKNWTDNTEHVFSMLLQSKLFDLAVDFNKFMDNTPWSRYLQGRLQLALGDHDGAAMCFHDAADGLAEGKEPGRITMSDTAGLLSDEEQGHFRAGKSRYYQHVASLFEKLKVFSYTADFASVALNNVHGTSGIDKKLRDIDMRKSSNRDSPATARIDDTMEEIRLLKVKDVRDEIAAELFNALVQTGRHEEAYQALRKTKSELARANLKTLVEACIRQEATQTLLQLPFSSGHAAHADAVLLDLARKSLKSGATAKIPHHQILYAFRTGRADYRGAAEILYEYLERLRHSEDNQHQDPEDETLIQAYLLLINTLACCGKDDGWLLADPIAGVHEMGRKRKLVTLDEVRREYSAELDRRSDMLQGRFPLVGGGDAMDVF